MTDSISGWSRKPPIDLNAVEPTKLAVLYAPQPVPPSHKTVFLVGIPTPLTSSTAAAAAEDKRRIRPTPKPPARRQNRTAPNRSHCNIVKKKESMSKRSRGVCRFVSASSLFISPDSSARRPLYHTAHQQHPLVTLGTPEEERERKKKEH
ncbi:uncharacterized protein K452DRAFT_114714 [Aplosporella prunicola CBS 121167]|uniref:Uncharacterized protein n=1 Tax=Aplosporella prunicola CBS 121167 TaxID=1176127 RepID=A0A6A6B0C3_9PEZI|nr:uncharacterized protein K452DRAFT_114714 [Aplosporella prunicola CBS 121167]KAF2136998.1 hypothetical protein K452DRAFT_114714 [Aplosporella prunicola CBS 121167]